LKINRITVGGLFGVFNHDIRLNSEDNITIVIGENGLGKTVILEAINALFQKEYRFFKSLEFSEFNIYFDNCEIWQLTKKTDSEGFCLLISRNSTKNPVKVEKKHKIFREENRFNRSAAMRDRELMRYMQLKHENRLINRDLYYKERYDLEREYEYRKMEEMRYHRLRNHDIDLEINPPKWLLENIEKINVKLIETQRIITVKEIGSDSYVNNLKKCSDELKSMIGVAVKKSSIVASELDSSYPNRLVKKLRQGTRDSFEELNIALAKLDERRKLFSSIGLAVQKSDSDLLQIDEGQKNLVNVLKLYIDDSHKKLDPLDELSQKIKLFKGIINKRFKHKKLEIKQEEGFVFRSTVVVNRKGDFETIPPSKLSSGEQNELILFYKLIFNSHVNDMILIDEPELSLHISWQNKFIKDLKSITSINGVSIIIATHSPDIIDDNWDLRVELKGVE